MQDDQYQSMRREEAAETNRLKAMREPMNPALRLLALIVLGLAFLAALFLAEGMAKAYGPVKCSPKGGCQEHIRPWAKPIVIIRRR